MRRANVNGAWAKNRREHIVPVVPELVQLHREYMLQEYTTIDSDFVFVVLAGPTRGNPMTPDAVAKMVARLRARTGIYFTPHMLRHTYATDFVPAGGRIEALSELLTHSSTESTRVYLHLSPEQLRAEMIERTSND